MNRAVWYVCILYIGIFLPLAALAVQNNNLLTVSANWNGFDLSDRATSTLPLDQAGTFSWQVSYDASNTQLATELPTLSNATYTLQLYKGTIGNSLLVYSATIPHGTATSSGSFAFPFPGAGSYMLAYTATYPPDTYPIGMVEACKGDFCFLPEYSLPKFQSFMTSGQFEDLNFVGAIPALFALNQFTLASPPGPQASNVLFLPGTMESRLYRKNSSGKEELLWEPTNNSDISSLAFDSGASKNQVYTRDIVDYLYSSKPILAKAVASISKQGSQMYAPFEKYMDGLVQQGIIKAWKAYPYDWRYDVADIVKNGTLVADANANPGHVYLQQIVESLASSSPTGQVTIIAHSNGGLLAKALAVTLEKSGKLNLLDKIILVGAPQFGTPFAIGNLLHADGQTRALGLVTRGDTMRSVALSLPGPYDLLPSSAYFNYVATPIISFATTSFLNSYRSAYGNSITTTDAFTRFLIDTARLHSNADPTDLRIPAILSDALLAHASSTHKEIDAWVPAGALSLVSIIGMERATPSGYIYGSTSVRTKCPLLLHCKKQEVLSHVPTFTPQGDDTVVSISAGGNPGTSFYFDTASYEKDSGVHIVHQNLLSAAPIQNELSNLIINATSSSAYISATLPAYNIIPDVVVSTHSPIDILVTDSEGRQTGVVPIPGTDMSVSKEEIPGSYVETIDDEKYVYLPSATYTVSLQGYDDGISTIEVGASDETGKITTTDSFEILTTPQTTASFSLIQTAVSSIKVDTDGDGTTDISTSSTSGLHDDSAQDSQPTSNSAMKQNTSSGQSIISKENVSPLEFIILNLKVKLLQLQIALWKLLHPFKNRETLM
jgi:pimeloyl-ACP methyl ester carboxylesterase